MNRNIVIACAAVLGLAAAACESAAPAATNASPPQPENTAPVEPPTEADNPAAALSAEEQAFAASISDLLRRNRYMERNCTPASFPEWEGFPLILCSYEKTNTDGGKRAATVIMLNPSAEQLAQWIFSSCRAIGKDNPRCRIALYREINGASNAQFPVAGVVLEDLYPIAAEGSGERNGDGYFESYTFRNGVTVKLDGVPNGALRQLSDEEIAAALSAETVVTESRKYARIVSTSPNDYRANGGTADVGTTTSPSLNWPPTVSALYRAAWGTPENELITAWARAHPERLE